MAPWITIIAKTIPWVELVRRAPDIIEGSRRLLDKSRAEPSPAAPGEARGTEQQLRERIAALEAREAEQAQVVAQMVEQLDGLTTGLTVLAARNRLLLYVVSAVSVALIVVIGVLLFG